MSAEGGCLSLGHIRSQATSIDPAKVEISTDATFSKVAREKIQKVCEACGELFWIETFRAARTPRCFGCRLVKRICVHCQVEFDVVNSVLRSSDEVPCPSCGGMNPGLKRGEITRFSQGSRMRLMQLLNKVQRDVSKVMFVTLTYPDEYYGSHDKPDHWKADLRAFEHRFRRKYPEASFVWRLEVKERLSGDHIGISFPHFHLLVFNVSLVELRPWVAENWNQIAGCGSAEHLAVHEHEKTVTAVLSRRGVMSYASKAIGEVMSSELSKDLQAKGVNVGRWWGVAVRGVFEQFLSIVETFRLTDRQAINLIRLFRKKIGIKGLSLPALSIFLSGEWLARNLEYILSPPLWPRYRSTGRDHERPFWYYAYSRNLLSVEQIIAMGKIKELRLYGQDSRAAFV